MSKSTYGVDLHSSYQAAFNFKEAAADGYDFAFVKASQGDTGMPPGFDAYFARAANNMNVVGAYHFLDSTMGGADQADMFLKVVRRNGGADGKLLAVDFEPYAGGDPTNGNLASFVRRLKSLTDDHPVICYTTYNYWNGGVPSGAPGQYGIDAMWEARVWSADERRPNPKSFYRDQWLPWYRKQDRLDFPNVPTPLRQFSWGGYSGALYVDVDAFEGSLADLKKLTK